MQTKTSEAAARATVLADQYRPIGPAAVLAAVLCAAKKIEKQDAAKAEGVRRAA